MVRPVRTRSATGSPCGTASSPTRTLRRPGPEAVRSRCPAALRPPLGPGLPSPKRCPRRRRRQAGRCRRKQRGPGPTRWPHPSPCAEVRRARRRRRRAPRRRFGPCTRRPAPPQRPGSPSRPAPSPFGRSWPLRRGRPRAPQLWAASGGGSRAGHGLGRSAEAPALTP